MSPVTNRDRATFPQSVGISLSSQDITQTSTVKTRRSSHRLPIAVFYNFPSLSHFSDLSWLVHGMVYSLAMMSLITATLFKCHCDATPPSAGESDYWAIFPLPFNPLCHRHNITAGDHHLHRPHHLKSLAWLFSSDKIAPEGLRQVLKSIKSYQK